MYLKHINLALAFILSFIPISVYAGKAVDKTFGLNDLFADSVVIAILAVFSLAGGVGSNFIHTDADEFIRNPNFAKAFIGFFLGLSIGLALYNYYGLSVYVLLAPVLIVSSLGSAILVFYMRWFSAPDTQKKLNEKINGIAFNRDSEK